MTGNLNLDEQSTPSRSISSWWRGVVSPNSEDLVSFPHMRPNLGRSLSSNVVRANSTSGKFSRRIKKEYGIKVPKEFEDSPIFGVPFDISLEYASVNIMLTGHDGKEFVYGQIPIVVARCAAFLKQEGTKTPGIFRIAGSFKRVRALQELFNSPPNFGKDLKWEGFNVHDAANLLKRYFLSLPAPIIPIGLYSRFREPLQHEFRAIGDYMSYFAVSTPGTTGTSGTATPESESECGLGKPINMDSVPGTPRSLDNNNNPPLSEPEKPSQEVCEKALKYYEDLINELPDSSKVILVYILDLLSVFAADHELNKMTAYNLSAIFQPSILSIKEHDMNPEEYQISSLVIEYLVDNSAELLKRVQERTVLNRSAPPPPPQQEQPQPQPHAGSSDHTKSDTLQVDKGGHNKQHRRQHSKSLSSVFVPRIEISNANSNSSSNSNSNSKLNEEESEPTTPDAKSKPRRGLKGLMSPSSNDSSAQSSPKKPSMSRSSSWRALFSSEPKQA